MPSPLPHDDCRARKPGHWLSLYVRAPATRSFVRVGEVCTACRRVTLTAHFTPRLAGPLEVLPF